MGEFCFRDLESMMVGTIILKPSHEKVDTLPNMMIDNETFIPCKYDWSDLEEKIDYVLSDYNNIRERLVENMRKRFEEKYNLQNLVLHFYNVLSNLDGVVNE